MKRGKDDDKITGPMFPRLHVNDTEKGGPRAPPRNKMALYEQLSTPSHRFNHGVFPPNSSDINNFVPLPAASTSQGSGTGQNLGFSRHVVSSTTTSSHVGETLHSRQPDDRSSNASSRHLEQRRKIADEDDFMVPVFVHSSQEKTQIGNDRESPPVFGSNHLACSKQILKTGDVDENNTRIGTIPRQDRKNQNGEYLELGVSSRDLFVRSSISSSSGDDIARSGNASLNQQNDLPDANFCRKENVCLPQEPAVLVQQNDNRCGESVSKLTGEIEKRNNPGRPIVVSDSYSGDNLNCQGDTETDAKFHGDKTCKSQQFVNGDKSDISETSVVESITEVTVTPDDVVGLIGQKRFWKARRAIVNQQRLFALQVFELHKLIKVQQLIAASPHLLLETSGYLAKPSSKVSSAKKLPSEYILVPPVHIAKSKKDSDEQNHKNEHSADNGVGKTKNGNQPSNHEPYMGNPNPTPIPMPTNNQMGPWGLHQWLVPVMSPSEGLVYKPYTTPMDGGSHPFGAIPFNGNFFNPFYGVPPYHHPHGNSYFPPYGMPVERMNFPSESGSQGGQSGGLSGVGANFNLQQNQSSCNLPTKKRVFDNSQVTKPRASRESKVPAISPSKKVQAGQPMASATEPLENRVIKVVPHSRTSASESAARIFRSIQQERKQHDSD